MPCLNQKTVAMQDVSRFDIKRDFSVSIFVMMPRGSVAKLSHITMSPTLKLDTSILHFGEAIHSHQNNLPTIEREDSKPLIDQGAPA